jgi:hypothetical protein
MSGAAIVLPHRAPYTVDDLFELPDDGNRYEVFAGVLQARAITNVAVRIADDTGPIPDITVTTAEVRGVTGALSLGDVHTVVEVVSPSSVLMDRTFKTTLYEDAGIPCYWRVELKPSRGYGGPLSLIVVRFRDADGWHTVEAAAGAPADLPVAVGPDRYTSVKLDPATLLDDR